MFHKLKNKVISDRLYLNLLLSSLNFKTDKAWAILGLPPGGNIPSIEATGLAGATTSGLDDGAVLFRNPAAFEQTGKEIQIGVGVISGFQ